MKKLIIPIFVLLGCNARIDEELLVSSQALEAEISVRIIETAAKQEEKDLIYITDGEGFLDRKVDAFLDSLTEQQLIPGAYYAYVSSVNERTGTNDRDRFFFCNDEYLHFFEDAIISEVEQAIGRSFSPHDRNLIGISFGGLNGAFFAAKSSRFKNYALLSPLTYPCDQIHASIAFSEVQEARVFISTGTNDAENYAVPLAELFRSKDFEVEYVQTLGSHDFENWKKQLAEVINFLVEGATRD